MTGLEIWLLAIGLAMDCFAVSIASGIILKRTQWRPMLVMAFAFGFFQALMPFIGWMFAKSFSHLIESVDHWIAFAILAFLGGRMILESFKEEECCKLFNPANPKVVLTMAIATPNYLVDSKFNKAMKAIPFLAAGMIFNMLLRKKK